MQKVTGEHSGFLKLQNGKFHFWERERGRVNEDRTYKREILLLQSFWGTGEDINREIGRGSDENWEVGWEDKVKDWKGVY